MHARYVSRNASRCVFGVAIDDPRFSAWMPGAVFTKTAQIAFPYRHGRHGNSAAFISCLHGVAARLTGQDRAFHTEIPNKRSPHDTKQQHVQRSHWKTYLEYRKHPRCASWRIIMYWRPAHFSGWNGKYIGRRMGFPGRIRAGPWAGCGHPRGHGAGPVVSVPPRSAQPSPDHRQRLPLSSCRPDQRYLFDGRC